MQCHKINWFPLEKLAEQIQRRTDKPQPIQNHRFQHLPWAYVVQRMSGQNLVRDTSTKTHLIDNDRYQPQMIQIIYLQCRIP
jgi:hypothetical protein